MASRKHRKAATSRRVTGGQVATETLKKITSNVANKAVNIREYTMQNAAEQMEKTNRDMLGRMEEAAGFHRNNMDAFMQASQVWNDGLKEINQAVFATMQSCMENAMSTGKAMMGVKTMRDMMELQSDYCKNMFDQMMAESTKVSEIAVRCSSEAAAPINERVSEVVEKISKKAA